MHVNCRIVGKRDKGVSPIWFYKFGFGIWIGRFLFGIGHDTRPRTATVRSHAD